MHRSKIAHERGYNIKGFAGGPEEESNFQINLQLVYVFPRN